MKEHKSVMPDEALDYLHITKKAWCLDATLGGGGHTIKMLGAGAKVIGIDADPKMLAIARNNIANACPANKDNFVGLNYNFSNLDRALLEAKVEKVEGVLFDLGISSVHLDSDVRGFSFRDGDQDLDMRLDPHNQNVRAADLLNALDQTQLTHLFAEAMPEHNAKKLAKSVVKRRSIKSFEKVVDFLELFNKRSGKIHPATTAFMALRMAVNTEFENLEKGLEAALNVLVSGGHIVVIAFHSGEDRIVKTKFKSWQDRGFGQVETIKPVMPTKGEVINNPRARSAKLRSFRKK